MTGRRVRGHLIGHVVWFCLGAALALGLLTGVGGNGWLLILGVIVASGLLVGRGGKAALHGLPTALAGLFVGFAGIVALSGLMVPGCPEGSVACSVGAAGDATASAVAAILLAVAVLVWQVLFDRRSS